MLALARALVTRPRVLMIDELSLGLAPRITTRLLDAVRRVAREEGVGVLLVEQHVAGGAPEYTETLPNFGVVWEAGDALKLYASYAEGYTVADIGRVLRGIKVPGQDVDELVDRILAFGAEILAGR